LYPSQSVREIRLGFMPEMQVISTFSSPTVFLMYSIALFMSSAGFRRIFDVSVAFGGMTLTAEEPCIWVNATVVRIRALSSPPLFLQIRPSTGKKSFLFEYNYRSSIAKAIHKRLREKLNFKQELLNTPWEKLSLEQKIEMGEVEHIRWNAYMRSEGYRYAPKRNDLAKVHYNLVPVSQLSNDDLRKDA